MSFTTFDYIPKLILGKSSNKTYNAINLIIRAIAFFIYFKTNKSVDILEMIIAYVFPLIYILYKVGQTSSSYILGLFRLRGSGERCIERRGAENDDKKPGNRKSIVEDAKKCSDVDMSSIDAKQECNSVRSVGDENDNTYPAGVSACLYIEDDGEEDIQTQLVNCSIYNNEDRCENDLDNNNRQLCRWKKYKTDMNSGNCNKDIKDSKLVGGLYSIREKKNCPTSCAWRPDETDITRQCIKSDLSTDISGLKRGVCLDN